MVCGCRIRDRVGCVHCASNRTRSADKIATTDPPVSGKALRAMAVVGDAVSAPGDEPIARRYRLIAGLA